MKSDMLVLLNKNGAYHYFNYMLYLHVKYLFYRHIKRLHMNVQPSTTKTTEVTEFGDRVKTVKIKTTFAPQQRLYSLDALRGFDMFWIMGAEEIFHNLYKATGSPFWGAISTQLTHPAWNGFHFYDLIFPLFLFMAGVATPYSVGRELEKGKSKSAIVVRILKRCLLLILFGLIVNNGIEIKPISEIRFGSVLGRIGTAYLFANLIYLFSGKKWQMAW